jgi:hypothetical protein
VWEEKNCECFHLELLGSSTTAGVATHTACYAPCVSANDGGPPDAPALDGGSASPTDRTVLLLSCGTVGMSQRATPTDVAWLLTTQATHS